MPNKARSNYHWLICGYFYNISTLMVCMKMVQEIHHIKDCYEKKYHILGILSLRMKATYSGIWPLARSFRWIKANIDAI